MFRRVFSAFFIVLSLGMSSFAHAGEYDYFIHLSPREQLEAIGKESDPKKQQLMLEAIKAEIERLRVESETDGLTGLRNRKSWDMFRRDLDRGIGGEREFNFLALITFDLDFFKHINDTYGHEVGDKVLRAVAAVVGQNVREPIFRVGGEEFWIALLSTSIDSAKVVAERVRTVISSIQFKDYPELRLSASVGISGGMAGDVLMAKALEQAADEALYKAKQNGRNRVEIAPVHRACEILLDLSLVDINVPAPGARTSEYSFIAPKTPPGGKSSGR